MKKKIASLKKVEEEMCYLELGGFKKSHLWKNKKNYRDKLVKEIYSK